MFHQFGVTGLAIASDIGILMHTVVLAWLFVVLRYLQAYVHVTDNYVPRRGSLFLAGALVLAVMWAIFIVRILIGLG